MFKTFKENQCITDLPGNSPHFKNNSFYQTYMIITI